MSLEAWWFGLRFSVSRYPSSILLPLYFGVSALKLNTRKKGTLIITGALGNPGWGLGEVGKKLVRSAEANHILAYFMRSERLHNPKL